MDFDLRFIALILVALPALAGNSNWPQFRGPQSDGHSDAVGLPTQWSESQNIKWKTTIPGEGWSSPVIWGDQIWLTTAIDQGKSLHALCVDKASGRITHDVEVFHVDHPAAKHPLNSYASPTPVIEEGRVYVCFGTSGSACLDTITAKSIWINLDLKCDHLLGAGSSPVVFENLYLLCCDGGDVQYLAALDKTTGKLAWKADRTFDHVGKSGDLKKAYNTPLVVNINGQDEIISIGAHRFYGHDVRTGREIWHCDQPGFSNVSQPVFGDGVVYLSTGFGKADLWAVRCAGEGTLTPLWKYTRGTPSRSTPLLVEDVSPKRIFMTTDEGIAHCVDAATGKSLWIKRLGSEFSASPLCVQGLVWCFDQDGKTTILKADPDKPRIVAENHLDDGVMATPAISGSALFLRTGAALYRIEE